MFMLRNSHAATAIAAIVALAGCAAGGADKSESASGAAKAPAALPIPAVSGTYNCDEGKQVSVARDAVSPERIAITWQGRTYDMSRLATSSGLPRFESRNGNLIWIDTPSRSVLLDANTSKPLAMGCRP